MTPLRGASFRSDGVVQAAKLSVEEEINLTSASSLHPPLDETALIQELVAQFLAHDGYVETGRAFAEEVEAESRALRNTPNSRVKDVGVEEDLDAINRQRTSHRPWRFMRFG